MAASPRLGHHRLSADLPLCSEPARTALAVANGREHFRCRGMAWRSALLSWYLGNFAHYDATYGSLGAGIGLMMWMWVSSIVILFGAQLNSEIEHQTAQDSTVERDRPLGSRGAVMADTVGEAMT